MQKVLAGVVGAGITMILTGCGSAGLAASSIVTPCPAIEYEGVIWSPDGKHIAFLTHYWGDPMQILVMNPDGAAIQRLADFSWGQIDFQWLPDNQTLAYHDSNNHVFTVTLDGTTSEIELSTVTALTVLFSPDGKTIAYHGLTVTELGSYLDGIYVANRDGSGVTQLTSGRDILWQWSPDGTHLAYVHVDQSGNFISTIRVDGRDQRALAKGDGSIRWSPDGQWLSFQSPDGIYVIKPDGTSQKLVTQDISTGKHGWLPDSQHIAFVSSWPDAFLKVVTVNTLEVETIAQVTVSDKGSPSWSPDGRQVVFIGLDDIHPNGKVEELYMANRDGSGLKRLTDNPGRYQCFNWPF